MLHLKKISKFTAITLVSTCFNAAIQAETLKMGVNHNAPPYIYINEKGDLTGFTIELAKAIGKEAGFDVEVVALPFVSVIKAMENKEIDIIGHMYSSAERAKIYNFVNSYDDQFKFIRLKDRTSADLVTPLNENTRVPVIEGSPQFKELQAMKSQDYPTIEIRDLDTNFLAFKELFQKKSDIMFAPISEINSLRNNYKEYEFQILDIPSQYSHIQVTSINYAIRKEEEALHERISKGFEIAKSNGVYDELIKKYNL